MRRVVITGLGMVSPLGGSVEHTWSRLIAGDRGASAVTAFQTDDEWTPVTLTAPAQGLQYVGETATATFKGTQLTIVEGDGRTRICEREGTR